MTATEVLNGENSIPTPVDAQEHQARSLFDRIYELREAEPFGTPRRILLDDAAGRAVKLYEVRRQRAKRLRYRMAVEGAFAVIEWVPRYDGRDCITGHSKHTSARFNSFEDAERYVAEEYDEHSAAEASLEIEGPYCPVRCPPFLSTSTGSEIALPF